LRFDKDDRKEGAEEALAVVTGAASMQATGTEGTGGGKICTRLCAGRKWLAVVGKELQQDCAAPVSRANSTQDCV
jgi:hypothetical protein